MPHPPAMDDTVRLHAVIFDAAVALAARIYRLILDAQPEPAAESVITVDDAGVIRVRDGAREEIQ